MNIIGRFKRLNFWNKFFVIAGMITIICGLITFVYVFIDIIYPRVTKSDLESGFNQFREQIVADNSRLMEKYDLGYSIFYIDKKAPVIYNPISKLNEEQISIRWPDSVLDWNCRTGYFCLHMPEVIYHRFNISNAGGIMGIPKIEGYEKQIFKYPSNIVLKFEVLIAKEDRVVFLIGLQEL